MYEILYYAIQTVEVVMIYIFLFRVFRIGQRHDVKVYRFISEGTIEEILYLRQVYKQVTYFATIVDTAFT